MTTAKEMYQAFLAELRKENTASVTPEEFNYIAHAGQLQWVQTRYYLFETDQKHIEDLQAILVRTTGVGGMPTPLTNKGAAIVGKEYFTLPDNTITQGNKMFLINVSFELAGCTDFKVAGVKRMDNVVKNAYDRPSDSNLYYQQYDNRIWRYDVGKGKKVANRAMVSYLRYPRDIKVDVTTGESVSNSEFDSRTNVEIVKFMVRTFLETIESQRQETFSQEQAGVYNSIQPSVMR
jgi:hypothetical protein